VRVALVHDWLTGMRGGERCLARIAGLFPDAEIFTLFHVSGTTSSAIETLPIHASGLSRLPGAARHYRKLLPLFPSAIERFDLTGFDLVMSTSHAVAKGVRTRPDQLHLCYCFTPMRYVWDQADAYLGTGLRRAVAAPLVGYLRRFDRRTASVERVSRFVAISSCVRDRIRTHYGRDASIVFPPVEVDRFPLDPRPRDDLYVMIGGFVPYKREALAIEAFRGTHRRLVIVGDGPSRRRLAAGAPPNVELPGRLQEAELARLLGRCRALIHPQVEDFGIAAVEAQSCGTPVVAFRAGGALDTVVAGTDAPTGVFFEHPTAEALRTALERFESDRERFDPRRIHEHAMRFRAERFDGELLAEVAALGGAAREVARDLPPRATRWDDAPNVP
jgi:glycosyltransferase involved in cell wall biosynthesis